MDLLVISGGDHPYHQSTPILLDFLKDAGHNVEMTEDANLLVSNSMKGYDALVFHTLRVGDMTLDYDQRTALTQYIGGGKGFVCIHCAGALAEGWPEYHDVTGGGWIYGGSRHPRYGQYKMIVRETNHPCASGISDFITNDELYLKIGWRPDNDVFLVSEFEGESHPMAWTRKYGNGRVFKTTLGHDGLSFRTPAFQRLILNGVDWATTKD